jgi:predicted amidohydrolase YtcJ
MDEKRFIVPGVLACLMMSVLWGPLVGVSRAQEIPPEVLGYADLVLYNAQVLTMDRDRPPITVVEALAVREGRIMAVGDNDRILRMAGPDTVKVDLDGKAVIPGIVDTHSHPNSYTLRHYGQEINPAYGEYLEANGIRFATVRWDSNETALADFKRVAESIPAGHWIYATSRQNPTVLNGLTRFDLDEVTPDRPLYVKIGNAQFGLADSEMLDIVRETYGQLPPGILVDEQGVPTGRVFGGAGTLIDQEIIPQIPAEILAPAFKKELEEWVAIGVTTLSTRLKGSEMTAYGQLDRAGQLPLRIAYSNEIGRDNPYIERSLKRYGDLQGHGTPWMWMIGITVGIPDGTGPAGRVCTSMEKREMLPGDLWPDSTCHWELPGFPGADTVRAVNRYGYRVSGVHTFGDKAYLMMLDAFAEASQETSILGRRFALDHGQMITPEVIKRSAELGIIWSLQPPQYYRSAAIVNRIFGEEYAHRWTMPVRSLIDAGVKVTYGADTHDDPQRHPMHNLEVLVTRVTQDGRIFGSRERIERAEALLMMTRWGAEYVLREEELGSLEPGKLADLVVLDRSPLDPEVPDEDLSEITVVATLIGGEVAHGSLD